MESGTSTYRETRFSSVLISSGIVTRETHDTFASPADTNIRHEHPSGGQVSRSTKVNCRINIRQTEGRNTYNLIRGLRLFESCLWRVGGREPINYKVRMLIHKGLP